MKKLLLILFFYLPIYLSAQQTNVPYDWQGGMSDPSANYFNILEGARAHFDSVPNDSYRKTFQRWNRFWCDRNGGDNDPGTFEPAYKALLNSFNSTEPLCVQSPEGFEKWESLGPHVLPPYNTTVKWYGNRY